MITIEKITDISLMSKACTFTAGFDVNVKNPHKMYLSEHSPVRTQWFWIEMIGIPTFVSVHLVRHKIGVEHFVKTNRTDRGGVDGADRLTPVNHAMMINAQALINMARKRLCFQSSTETYKVMEEIKHQLKLVDKDLADCLLPECVYRGDLCYEFKCCGYRPKGY